MDYKAPENSNLVSFDESFSIEAAPTAPGEKDPSGAEAKALLKKEIKKLRNLQEVLYAHKHYAVLCVFQSMDAAGKDSTIEAVTTGVNPAGFQVYAFKPPSAEELEHDFLWRTSLRLPERGRIGIFNRSYYEEVLTVRVHPKFLDGQNLPPITRGDGFWKGRLASIRDHELHLARSGIVVLKFWLNVSPQEQRRRLLRRLNRPDKHWKFERSDMEVRRYWDDYMVACEKALRATSRPWAPWYVIPADDKPHMRFKVAKILVEQLSQLALEYPEVPQVEKDQFDHLRKLLEAEGDQ